MVTGQWLQFQASYAFPMERKKKKRQAEISLWKLREERYLPETFKFLWPESGAIDQLSCKRHRENGSLPLSDSTVRGTSAKKREGWSGFDGELERVQELDFYYNSILHTGPCHPQGMSISRLGMTKKKVVVA